MISSRLRWLGSRAKHVYRTEGLVSVLRRGLAYVLWRLADYRVYYVLAKRPLDYTELNEADFMPKITDFTPKVVSSNAEADQLEAEGLEFRTQVPNARQLLDNGAIALCIFVGNDFANFGWLLTSQRAMDIANEPPYKVDFSRKEMVGTGAWTKPKYRRLRLRRYNRFMSLKVSQERGVEIKRGAEPKNNVPAMRSRAPANRPYAEGRCLRVLWWRWWKERPLAP